MGRQQFQVWTLKGLGAGLAVGAMVMAADLGETPVSLIPFVTSIAVVMGAPDSLPAQPRALVGGHLVSTLVGFLVLWVAGPSHPAAAAAVGLSVAVMLATRTFHPPASIDALLVVAESMSLSFLLVPVLSGTLLLCLFTYFWHRFCGTGPWPRPPAT